jgi:hypothetical protein
VQNAPVVQSRSNVKEEQPKPLTLNYATPTGRRKRGASGELGAIPTLLCLLAAVLALTSFALLVGIVAFVATLDRIGLAQAQVAAITAIIGVLSGWLAIWINREFRKPPT